MVFLKSCYIFKELWLLVLRSYIEQRSLERILGFWSANIDLSHHVARYFPVMSFILEMPEGLLPTLCDDIITFTFIWNWISSLMLKVILDKICRIYKYLGNSCYTHITSQQACRRQVWNLL